jgi:hypothetical protein
VFVCVFVYSRGVCAHEAFRKEANGKEADFDAVCACMGVLSMRCPASIERGGLEERCAGCVAECCKNKHTIGCCRFGLRARLTVFLFSGGV